MIYQSPSAHARNPRPQSSNTKDIPDGHVGLDSLHVCTTFFGGSKLTNLPVTPPPNKLYSFPGSATLCAGARVHCGIRFSSVSSENRSSAAAMKCASPAAPKLHKPTRYCEYMRPVPHMSFARQA